MLDRTRQHHITLQATPLTTASVTTIGKPKLRTRTREAMLNHARVNASAARGEGVRVGAFQYDGRTLTLLVRHGYITEAEANSYSPAHWRQFKTKVDRATTALVDDIVSGRITLRINL